jgi:hypothetical protein
MKIGHTTVTVAVGLQIAAAEPERSMLALALSSVAVAMAIESAVAVPTAIESMEELPTAIESMEAEAPTPDKSTEADALETSAEARPEASAEDEPSRPLSRPLELSAPEPTLPTPLSDELEPAPLTDFTLLTAPWTDI